MSKTLLDPQVKLAALVTVVVAGTLFFIKFYAFRLTGSQAIFSEAMESIVNVFASIIALYVIYYAAKPADKDHPYGHGKVEYLSAALEGGLIAFAAFLILLEASQAIYEQKNLYSLNLGLVLLALTGVINVLLGVYLKKVGGKKQSVALEASGQHLLADFWTSAGVIAGLGLVYLTDLIWLDAVVALFVGLHLIKEGYGLVRKAISGLLDEEETELIQQIQELVNKNSQEGIIQVHHLRIMRAGRYHHIDAHVVVPEFWSVEEAHDQTLYFERNLFKQYEFSGEFHFHIDPCRRLYCQFCDLKNCPVRKEEFKQKRKMSLTEITDADEPIEVVNKP